MSGICFSSAERMSAEVTRRAWWMSWVAENDGLRVLEYGMNFQKVLTPHLKILEITPQTLTKLPSN